MVTPARPPTRSSFKITNRSFRNAPLRLWNELPTDLRELRQIQSLYFHLSHMAIHHLHHFHDHHFHLLLGLLPTRSVFHSELKTWLFGNSTLDLFLSYRIDSHGSRTIQCFYSGQRLDLFAWCVIAY